MNNIVLLEVFSFNEWYHYAFLFLWMILLFYGLSKFYLIETLFKPKKEFEQDEVHGKKLLISSFLLGIFLFMAMTFIPARFEVNREYIQYGFYFIFLLLLIYNATVSIRFYKPESRALRSLSMTFLMVVYFYSGLLGGLMLIAVFALAVALLALLKLKKRLTIR